jgi:hypothetical protein
MNYIEHLMWGSSQGRKTPVLLFIYKFIKDLFIGAGKGCGRKNHIHIHAFPPFVRSLF